MSVFSHADVLKNVPVGPIEYIPLTSKPHTMITARVTGQDEENLIITYESSLLSIFDANNWKHIDLDFSVSLIEPIRTNDDNDLLVCIPRNSDEILIMRYNKVDKTIEEVYQQNVTNTPYYLQTTDVTGNGYMDIVVLLENQTGVGVLRNRGNDTFDDIEFLFDEILVSMFRVVDLNGDGLNDFILYDPIQNMLRFHYGFGDLMFALERHFPLPGSINYFDFVPIADDPIYDLVTLFPDEQRFRLYLGDGLGRYTLTQTHDVTSARNTFLFTDLFENKRNDLVVAERETGKLHLYRNSTQRGFEPAGYIQLPVGIRDMAILENKQTSKDDLYILDIEHDRLIILGRLPAVKDFLPSKLALASEPSDMVVANLFGGELPELYILCEKAATISVYWYNRRFELNHTMISLPGNPNRLYVHKGPPGKTKLVVSDDKSDLITIVSMKWDQMDADIYGIPAIAGSEVIYLGLTPDQRFQFGTLAFVSNDNAPMLSLFEQIGSEEYIEHTITPVQEEYLLALDVVDLTGNDAVDIVYMYRSNVDNEVYLSSALNDSMYVYRRHSHVLSLNNSSVSRGFLLSENITGVDGNSFIIYLNDKNAKNGRLYRVTGDQHGTLSLLEQNSGGKLIKSSADIFLMLSPDRNFSDIVYYNTLTSSIEMIQSTGDGLFLPPKLIMRVDNLSSFSVYSEPVGEVHMLVVGRKGKPYTEISRIDD